jgi:thymidine kinase
MDSNAEGYLSIYAGCMFAGKSSRLITKLSKRHSLGLKVVYITHHDDDRVSISGRVTTHQIVEANLPFDCFKSSNLSSMQKCLLDYDVIGVDEFQFFDEAAVDVIRWLVDVDKKTVYVAGLDGNFKRRAFGHLNKLIPLADKYTKITAKCNRCRQDKIFRDAPFTAKIGGDLNMEKEVGSDEKYIPLCRSHYLEYTRSFPVVS